MPLYSIELGDWMSVTLLFQSIKNQKPTDLIGVYGIPPRGGYDWWAINDTEGHVDDEISAQNSISGVVKGMKK